MIYNWISNRHPGPGKDPTVATIWSGAGTKIGKGGSSSYLIPNSSKKWRWRSNRPYGGITGVWSSITRQADWSVVWIM